MGINHLKDCLRVCHRAGVNAFVIGAHGTGKTTAIQQLWLEEAVRRHGAPDAMNNMAVSSTGEVDPRLLSTLDTRKVLGLYQGSGHYRFCQVSVPNLTLEEMVGMPHVEDHGKRYQDAYVASFKISAITGVDQPKVLADMCRDLAIKKDGQDLRYLRIGNLLPPAAHAGGGVLLADEMNRGQTEVAQAWMQLIVSGTYLDYVLPEDFWIVTTMNPDDSEYQVRSLDPALLNRGATFAFYPDTDEFLVWAKARGLSEGTRIFADKHRKFLNTSSDVSKIKSGVTCTNRSLELLDRAWRVMTDDEVGRLGQSIAAALIGVEAGALYFKEATENVHRPVRAEEIADGYGWNPEMTVSEAKDYKSWKVTKVRTKVKAMTKKASVKTELIKVTLDDMAEWVGKLDASLAERGSDKNGSAMTDKEKGQVLNILLFLSDLPADITRRFMLEDMNGKYLRTMYWAGAFPIVRHLSTRIDKDYRDAVEEEAANDRRS